MDYLESFSQWLIEDGKSRKTIESYGNDVKQFQKYLTEEAIDEKAPLSRYSFVRYKQQLLEEEYKVSTINKKVNSLKVYNDYLQLKGFVDDNYIQVRKDQVSIASGSEQVVDALTDAEINRVLAYIEDEEKVSIRNRLIIHLLLYTAVRVSELTAVKLADIDFVQHTLLVNGKGGKIREIGIRTDLLELIKVYKMENDKLPGLMRVSTFWYPNGVRKCTETQFEIFWYIFLKT